jgi:hypothetical protein
MGRSRQALTLLESPRSLVIFCVRGVASPLLANLFLHYVFDRWLATNYPQAAFERFVDDVIVHCKTETEALTNVTELRAGASSGEDEDRLLQG